MGENTHPSRECMHRVLSVETWKVILLPSLLTGGEGDDLSVCVNRSSWNPVLYQKVSVCANQAIKLLSSLHCTNLYIYSPGEYPYAPTAWSECRRLALEIRELSSAILSGRPQLEVHSSVTSGVLAVGWGERVEGAYVVAAVNYLKKPV